MADTFYQTKISGTGHYLPPKLLTNKDLEKLVETTDEWITERTGIKERHIADESQASSDLAYEAAKIAIKEAGLTPEDIDCIIFPTVTPDHVMPSSACLLQEKLGAKNCMTFDLTAACSGFIYAMSIAHSFIQTGHYKHVLCIGSEVLSKFVDYTDRGVCILFGDGSAAAVLSRAEEGEESKIYSRHCYAEGAHGKLLYLPMGGSAIRPSHEAIEANQHTVEMNGREIFRNAVRTMGKAAQTTLETNGMTKEDVDWFIPHQANARIIEAVAKHIDFPMEKVIVELADIGNTSAATIPIAMDRAIRDGRIKRGQNILLAAFGGGLTSGGLLLKY
ncbi:MAG: 3-oxoacyl-ACP synthase [Bdellovibrionaceae bacterium]|nr:3-oxoacyl-ACP synthase [Pseudobdellovibrionaceae bacterium]